MPCFFGGVVARLLRSICGALIGLGRIAGIRDPERHLRRSDWQPDAAGARIAPIPHQQESGLDTR